jgi:hypothetical protein
VRNRPNRAIQRPFNIEYTTGSNNRTFSTDTCFSRRILVSTMTWPNEIHAPKTMIGPGADPTKTSPNEESQTSLAMLVTKSTERQGLMRQKVLGQCQQPNSFANRIVQFDGGKAQPYPTTVDGGARSRSTMLRRDLIVRKPCTRSERMLRIRVRVCAVICVVIMLY